MNIGARDRRVVIVSPYFPPSTLAGVHRARLLARYLPSHGWEPVVVCVDERHHEEPLDEGLRRLVPPGVRVVRVGALSRRISRKLGIGDLSLRGWMALRRTVHRLLSTEGAAVVLITMGPFYSALLGSGIRRRFSVPVILDFQDPWVSRWGATLPKWSKGGWSHRFATVLEPHALRGADWITAVSEGTYEEIRCRNPWVNAARCTELPIGGDPADFQAALNISERVVCQPEAGERRISYVGTLLPRAEETARTFFAAVARLRSSRPDLVEQLRLVFVGTSNQPAGGPERVMPLAAAAGVADLVLEIPRRVSYLEALSVLRESHAVLALGSDEPHYTASKIYPALLSGRPVLALFHEASSVCRIVLEAGGALLVKYGDGDGGRVASQTEAVYSALRAILESPEQVPSFCQASLDPYLAPAIAGNFAEIFGRVAREGPLGLAG